MAKDPAFLFYSGDFLVGTALMSDQEIGQYIKLLCFVHQSGHIAKEDMINICPNVSPRVVAKFKIDSEGRYYNERLDKEVDKRKKYSESRRSNRMKKDMNNISKTHDESYVVAVSTHMENENENRNENEFKYNKESLSKIEVFDSLFRDQRYITDLSMAHKGKDLKQAFEECWIYHSQTPTPPEHLWQWKQKLNTWLTIKRDNATPKNKQSTSDLAQAFANRVVQQNSGS